MGQKTKIALESLFGCVVSINGKIILDIAGAKYELPKYVFSAPTNLIRDN